jgi:hypothetical protein
LKGKIVLYNIETGEGLIVARDKNKYQFSIEDWDDFENMPSVGMDVDFVYDIESEHIHSIETSSEDKEEEKKEELKRRGEEREKALKEGKKPEKLDVEEYSAKNVPQELLEVSIEDFFEDIKKKTAKIAKSSLVNDRFRLDFQLVKRFLFTAYNNLIEIDPDIANPSLTRIYNYLNELNELYIGYKKTHKYPKLAFSSIFLKRTKYKDAKRRLELNIEEIKSIKKTLPGLEEEIKDLSAQIASIPVGQRGEEYMNLVSELKRVKKKYVDSIDLIGRLREENEMLIPITDEYFERFFEEFTNKFSQKYEENIRHLEDILNSLTFTFDKAMWLRAKRSRLIQNYFRESNIEGDFSTATYLKYYLRSLDQSKLSAENEKLFEICAYLERKAYEYEESLGAQ